VKSAPSIARQEAAVAMCMHVCVYVYVCFLNWSEKCAKYQATGGCRCCRFSMISAGCKRDTYIRTYVHTKTYTYIQMPPFFDDFDRLRTGYVAPKVFTRILCTLGMYVCVCVYMCVCVHM
jgi:hypothetical protein